MNDVPEPPKVLASAANGVIEQIHRSGGDVEKIFSRADLRVGDLDSPFNELDLGGFCTLFEESAKQTQNEFFGLEFGAHFRPRQLGAIGFAAISSPTLSAALRNMEKHFPAHQGQSSFGLLQSADILWLNYRILDPRIEKKRHDAELSMGMFLNVFRNALGEDWNPLEVCFEHNATGDARTHEQVFGAPIRFGRRTNALAFRRADLDALMPESDPYLYSVIESFLKSRTALNHDPTDFAAVVRHQIKLQLCEQPPTAKEIARILGLSDYSFRQQLKDHRLSFRDLLKAEREELAMHYLQDADLPLTEVAALLGYSELSAFSRAFRTWTGMSPQRYRRHRQSTGTTENFHQLSLLP